MKTVAAVSIHSLNFVEVCDKTHHPSKNPVEPMKKKSDFFFLDFSLLHQGVSKKDRHIKSPSVSFLSGCSFLSVWLPQTEVPIKLLVQEGGLEEKKYDIFKLYVFE